MSESYSDSVIDSASSNNVVSTTGQSFRTIPVPNFNACLYTLSIREPGIGASEYLTYTFPLSPSALRKEPSFYTTPYDSPGTAQQLGVNRDINLFGQAPPMFTLEGTTGWQRHMTDGYLYTGLQSMRALEQFLETFSSLNQQVLESGSTQLYTLELYDYFRGDYYQVAPMDKLQIMQVSERPLLLRYTLSLIAQKRVKAPILGTIDAIANVFGSPATATAANVAMAANNFINVYSSAGIPSTGAFTS